MDIHARTHVYADMHVYAHMPRVPTSQKQVCSTQLLVLDKDVHRSNFKVAPSRGSRQKNLLELFQGSTLTGVAPKEFVRQFQGSIVTGVGPKEFTSR